MKNVNYNKIAKKVIETEINSLKKLKLNLNKSFDRAVKTILGCKNGKIVISGVGKSGIIGKKISSTLSSVGTPSFFVDASSCSHGDLGQIGSNDVLILISYSGESSELKNIIQYAKRNKIILIGIVSRKNSTLYKASNIKLYIPEVKESGYGIVPTSSTSAALALGDALAIAAMEQKKFDKMDFKAIHPAGSLGAKLKTVEDLMIKGKKIPFISENQNLKKAIKVISEKKLGVLIVIKKSNNISGIITDGDIRRIVQKNTYLPEEKIKNLMKKKPISVEKDTLAAEALEIMNSRKITSLSVYDKKDKKKIIGLIHIHNILEAKIA